MPRITGKGKKEWMYDNPAHTLKKRIKEAVKSNSPEGLLLSGGLDSSILAYLNPHLKAITISLKSRGEDAEYSKTVARFLNLKSYHREIEIEEALEAVPVVIKILKTFDPAIPNDLCTYFGITAARDSGIKTLMTGDGSDELFGGYSYMQQISKLNDYIKRIVPYLNFSSNQIGSFFNINIFQPYLNREIIDFALKIDPALKIKKDPDDKIWGKWILRTAFKGHLPQKIIWQKKRPLEYGSGMTELREIISRKVRNEEFEREKKQGKVKFISREHYFYYKTYMDVVGHIPEPARDQKACPGCRAGMAKEAFHCKVCGNVIKGLI
jgi:asparagine synthase (glutamine-hydrolysing)